jgi:hypothetical protein
LTSCFGYVNDCVALSNARRRRLQDRSREPAGGRFAKNGCFFQTRVRERLRPDDGALLFHADALGPRPLRDRSRRPRRGRVPALHDASRKGGFRIPMVLRGARMALRWVAFCQCDAGRRGCRFTSRPISPR